MLDCPDQRRSRYRSLGACLVSVVLMMAPLASRAGHDQVEDDLVYFLRIQPDHVKQLLDSGEKIIFIDLRELAEFKQQHLPGARSIPLKELLYCACPEGNIEEGYSYQLLREMGYRNVSVLEGGFTEWRRLGYPVETESNS
jgi:rhodanese-related sulfurtransferase